MVPVLLRPKILSLKNKWFRAGTSGSRRGRDFVLVVFSLMIMAGVYRGSVSTLHSIQTSSRIVYIHPSMPLGLLLMLLLAMLLFSNSVAALGTLFMGKDLDLLLSAPVTNARLFQAKVIEIMTNSSWMVVVFGLPILLAFGHSYLMPWEFYLLAMVIMTPYFLIPSAISIIVATLITRILPVNRTREILFVIAALIMVAIYWVVQLFGTQEQAFNNVDELMRVMSLLTLPQRTWLPSHWAATCIGEMLEGSRQSGYLNLVLLYSTAVALCSLAYIVLRQAYFVAYSKAKNSPQGMILSSKRSQQRLRLLTPIASQQFRALLAKELKTFARDLAQALQLLLLIGICMIYLYNFKFLHAVQGLPIAAQIWWKSVLVLINVVMGAFVITAVCTRFVFPSISLEGRCFWIIASAPISINQLLRAKFWMWLIPIATISSVIFLSGALAIDAAPHIVAINAIASWIICYGIVGMGVGLGALFADFDWDHASQLSASLGSLIYMLSSMFLVLINLLPTAALVFLRTLRVLGAGIPKDEWFLYVGCSALLLIYINFAAARWALKIGENALRQKMRR